jgi:hypothetical protein
MDVGIGRIATIIDHIDHRADKRSAIRHKLGGSPDLRQLNVVYRQHAALIIIFVFGHDARHRSGFPCFLQREVGHHAMHIKVRQQLSAELLTFLHGIGAALERSIKLGGDSLAQRLVVVHVTTT